MSSSTHGTQGVEPGRANRSAAVHARGLAERTAVSEHPRRLPMRSRSVRELVCPAGSDPAHGRYRHTCRLPSGTRSGRRQRLDNPAAMVCLVVVLRLRHRTRPAIGQPCTRCRSSQGTVRRPQPDGAAFRRGCRQLSRCGRSARSPPRSARRVTRVRRAQGHRSARSRHRRRLRQAAGDDDQRSAAWRTETNRPRPRQRTRHSAMHRQTSIRSRVRQRTIIEVGRPPSADTIRCRPSHPPTQNQRHHRPGHRECAADDSTSTPVKPAATAPTTSAIAPDSPAHAAFDATTQPPTDPPDTEASARPNQRRGRRPRDERST